MDGVSQILISNIVSVGRGGAQINSQGRQWVPRREERDGCMMMMMMIDDMITRLVAAIR